MKKLVLLITCLLMSLTTVTASEFHHGKKKKHLKKAKHYRYTQPIMFVERGVEFIIFPDGSFDFNINNNDYRHNGYLNNRRNNVNATYGRNRDGSISYDRIGKIKRIGNVYLNYDRYGKIKRAGNVYMDYNRGNRRLNQVGGLHIHYNHWSEIIRTKGQVNRFNNYCDYCMGSSCNMDHAYKKKHKYYKPNGNNDRYYYYKRNGKLKKHLKRK